MICKTGGKKTEKERENETFGEDFKKKLDKPVLLCYNTDNTCEDGRRVAFRMLPPERCRLVRDTGDGRVNTLPEQRAEADFSVGRTRRLTAVIPSERFWALPKADRRKAAVNEVVPRSFALE